MGTQKKKKLAHGHPRQPQCEGSVETADGDTKDTLTAWMNDNKSTAWNWGPKFVQLSNDSRHHARIGHSPFKAMFGASSALRPTTRSLLAVPWPKDVMTINSFSKKPEDPPFQLCLMPLTELYLYTCRLFIYIFCFVIASITVIIYISCLFVDVL